MSIFIKHYFKKQKFKPHFHNNYSIGLILKGEHKLNINGKRELILPTQFKVINPNELHFVDESSQWSYINLLLEKSEIKRIMPNIFENKKEIIFKTKIEDSALIALFLNLYRSKGSLEYEELLIEFIEKLLKYSSFDGGLRVNNASISKAIDFINSHFLEDINLEAIAAVLNLSKYHTIKLFRKEFNLTPYQYILRLRVEYGVLLIKKGYPLSQIALICGFSDQSHFIREFKKIYGFTPSMLKE